MNREGLAYLQGTAAFGGILMMKISKFSALCRKSGLRIKMVSVNTVLEFTVNFEPILIFKQIRKLFMFGNFVFFGLIFRFLKCITYQAKS